MINERVQTAPTPFSETVFSNADWPSTLTGPRRGIGSVAARLPAKFSNSNTNVPSTLTSGKDLSTWSVPLPVSRLEEWADLFSSRIQGKNSDPISSMLDHIYVFDDAAEKRLAYLQGLGVAERSALDSPEILRSSSNLKFELDRILEPGPVTLSAAFPWLSFSGTSVNIGATDNFEVAASYLRTVPHELQSTALWKLIFLAIRLDVPRPVVECLEDAVTIDFEAPGHLLSVLIETESYHLSVFSKRKEIRATWVAGDEEALEDFTRLTMLELIPLKQPK